VTGQDAKSIIRQRYDLFAQRDRAEKGLFKTENGAGLIGQRLLSEDELSKIPAVALCYFMGATTPTRLVEIKRGDTVLDLGCGVGVDAVLAAHKAGPTGKVVGIDLSGELIARGREVVILTGLKNIELLAGDMESLPVPSNSVDVVISNGAINLVPDKWTVFREAFRVLKKGGRLALCDIILQEKIEAALSRRFRENLSGCLAFAIDETEYLKIISDVGFSQIEVISRRSLRRHELDVMSACPDPRITPPPCQKDLHRMEGLVISIKLTAVKNVH